VRKELLEPVPAYAEVEDGSAGRRVCLARTRTGRTCRNSGTLGSVEIGP